MFYHIRRFSFTKSWRYLHSLENASPFQILHDNIKIFLILKVFKYLYYIRMIKLFKYLKFIIYSIDYFIWLFWYNFHSSDLICSQMHYHEYFSTTALPNLFDQFVTFSIRTPAIYYEKIPIVNHIVSQFFCYLNCLLMKTCLHSRQTRFTSRPVSVSYGQ